MGDASDGNGEKRIMHYSSSHKILLVGEGDFSFAACLAEALRSATNIVATSLDTRDGLIRKYSKAKTNLEKLEGLGCTVLHEVDAHTMSENALLKTNLFDRIVFNFPHSGFYYGARESGHLMIEQHQNLVKGFLRSAREMVAGNGEIHITHKTAHPFNRWRIVELADDVGLRLYEIVPFGLCEYPGYENKKGDGPFGCDDSFPVGQCSTFKFVRPHI